LGGVVSQPIILQEIGARSIIGILVTIDRKHFEQRPE
jgi:hypothetical protein